MQDDRSDFTQSRPLHGDIIPHVQWTLVLLSEALLAHDVYVCLERPSGALPPQCPSGQTPYAEMGVFAPPSV
jgi:hypothetical protein